MGWGRTLVYRTISLWQNDAASLIARQLASAHPTMHPDAASALDNARRQLIRALFDGAVHSEGVRWWGNPGPDDPSEPPPIPEPDEWKQIDPGWWSHERYERYVVRHQQTELEFLLLRSEGSTEEWVPKLPVEQVFEGTNVLDKIIVSWDASAFDFQGFEGDQGYSRIRVRHADIEVHFGINEAEGVLAEVRQPVDATITSGVGQPTEASGARRRTKPDPVRAAVYAWLERYRQERGHDWIRQKSNLLLASLYSKSLPGSIGDPDYVRKIIATWRKEHGLTRIPKS
jgi:hypothetical protein